MIGQKEGWEGWEGQAEREGLGSKDQSVQRNSWLFFPPSPILNNILLLKILFSEIYRAPKGQQLPLYPLVWRRKPQCRRIFTDSSSLERISFHIINMTTVLVTCFKFKLFASPEH